MAVFSDFDFNVLHENVIKVNFTERTVLHDYFAYSKLLNNALTVKNFSIFSNIEIPDYKHFKPFAYQKESIKTMLEKFEGRGVFGDQVGLGKTIQVLIAADVMFKNNQIKNAVIVCPKTLVDQWKNEINTKIPDRFNIIKNKDSLTINPFDNIMNLFNSDLVVEDKLNVVFIDSDNFKSHATVEKQMVLLEKKTKCEQKIKKAEQIISEKQAEVTEVIKNNPQQIQMYQAIEGLSREEACNKLAQVAILHKEIDELYADIENLKEEIKKLNEERLFNKPIDLLIIDESHKVIDQIQNSEYSELFDDIDRKYTILLSATPIEKNIDDIYDLVRFVDKNRFTDIEKFHAYVDGATSLVELVQNKTAMERMNGLINSLFTRKRLKSEEVQSSLNRKYDIHILVEIIKGNKERAYELISEIYGESELADQIRKHLDDFYSLSNYEELIEDMNNHIYKSSYPLRKLRISNPEQAIPIDNFINPETPFMNLYLNSYICNYFKETHLEFVFPFIEWAPAKRNVHFLSDKDVKGNQNEYISYQLMTDPICSTSKIIIYKAANEPRFELLRHLHSKMPTRPILCDVTIKVFTDKLRKNNTKYAILEFLRDEILCYSGLSDEVVQNFLTEVVHKFTQFQEEGKDVAREIHAFYKNFVLSQFNELYGELSNAVLLMDYTRFEGSDLHCASHLMLCQKTQLVSFDKYEKEGIDPLTLEQFVGRIYRIGQPSEAHITIFQDEEEYDELFELYNDPKGLDLFGEGKNEIGFVVPVLVEKWAEKIKKDSCYTSYIKSFKVEPDSFVHIFMILRQMQEHTNKHDYIEEFKESIREVCKTLAVGKKGE